MSVKASCEELESRSRIWSVLPRIVTCGSPVASAVQPASCSIQNSLGVPLQGPRACIYSLKMPDVETVTLLNGRSKPSSATVALLSPNFFPACTRSC